MALYFTIKEAKHLIDRHKALLSDLGHVAEKAAAMQADIKRSANELITQTTLKRLIINDCARPSENTQRTSEIESLVYH